jgi:hypothetical protein
MPRLVTLADIAHLIIKPMHLAMQNNAPLFDACEQAAAQEIAGYGHTLPSSPEARTADHQWLVQPAAALIQYFAFLSSGTTAQSDAAVATIVRDQADEARAMLRRPRPTARTSSIVASGTIGGLYE